MKESRELAERTRAAINEVFHVAAGVGAMGRLLDQNDTGGEAVILESLCTRLAKAAGDLMTAEPKIVEGLHTLAQAEKIAR